ncbi:MAG: helix-turn-helix transcriptional regulator [Saprospiraceae bacterium]|jgi:y4mF family transcriptional regulator|nr:helix-turn-helix transcriptional regulator [Saprospiraceae bacterium]
MSILEIGQTIKTRRKSLGVTQPHLAELADVSINTLYKMERGVANPTLAVVLQIADVLGLEVIVSVKQPQ